MDFKDYFKQLSERIPKLKDQIATEEATKNAFIMPFIYFVMTIIENQFADYTSTLEIRQSEYLTRTKKRLNIR